MEREREGEEEGEGEGGRERERERERGKEGEEYFVYHGNTVLKLKGEGINGNK